MNKNIKGIHHLALKCAGVSEFEKTVHFYCEILRLTLVRKWGEGDNMAVMLDTGAGFLEIFANASDMPSVGALRHFALDVESCDFSVEAVRASGYTVTVEPCDIVIPSDPPYAARIAFCIGPVGEEIEFFQVK